MDNQLTESSEIPLDSVALKKKWTFWENYETRDRDKSKKDYSNLLKKIYTFNTIIEFWQFWNYYPGSDPQNIFYDGEKMKYFFKEKYRIVAMNFFVEGIKPEWEDEQNKGGKIFTLEYTISNEGDIGRFMETVKKSWTEMILSLLGEILPQSEYINGIRFVDKSQFNKKNLFRFEIWLNKNIPEQEVSEAKREFGEKFGCPGITVKDI